MDGHIHEDAAGNLDVAHRLVIRIAGSDLDEVGLAQLAGGDRVADSLVVVVEAADKADLQLYACLLDGRERLLDLCQLGVDRLLAEDVLAGLSGAHDEVRMGRGGRADEHSIDGRVGEDLLRVVVAFLDAHFVRPCAGRIVHERISDCVQLCVRYGVRQILAMQLADAASAQQTDSYFLFHFSALLFTLETRFIAPAPKSSILEDFFCAFML